MNVMTHLAIKESMRKAWRLIEQVPINMRGIAALRDWFFTTQELLDKPAEYRLAYLQTDGKGWRISNDGPFDDPLSAEVHGDLYAPKGVYKIVEIVDTSEQAVAAER